MEVERSRIWTDGFRRFGPAARGSSWTGWSLWLDDQELEHFRKILQREKSPEAEALRQSILKEVEQRSGARQRGANQMSPHA